MDLHPWCYFANGAARLNFTVSDGQLSTNNHINLTINPINDAPTAYNVSYSLNEDGSIVISAAQLLQDSGALDIDSANLTVSAVSANGDIHGSLINNSSSTWTYTPSANFNGPAQLSLLFLMGN